VRSVKTHSAHFMGCEARKIPAVGEVFFLTSPFIELYVSGVGINSADRFTIWFARQKCRVYKGPPGEVKMEAPA
jgi:hypothetical protein